MLFKNWFEQISGNIPRGRFWPDNRLIFDHKSTFRLQSKSVYPENPLLSLFIQCLFIQSKFVSQKKQREKKKSHFSWEIFSNLSLGRKSRRFKSFRRNQSVREDAAHFVKIERESETENRSQSDFLHSALFSESNLFKWAHLR